MKKLLAFIFLVSAFANAQYSIKGTMTPAIESDWVILYKTEGARQSFIQNTTIKIDSVLIDGKNKAIGTFEFLLPKETKPGSYRATYRLEGAGFVDFIFNNEDVHFTFNSEYPEQSVAFSKSKENIVYSNYLNDISAKQQKLDSLQIAAINNLQQDLKVTYKNTLEAIYKTQKKYLSLTNGMYVSPFIKATLRANPSEIKTTGQAYMSNMIATFFDNINFEDKTLLNSSFLVDRIIDYVFYINYSDDAKTQQKLYKKSIDTVISKVRNVSFKKEVIEFLIAQFEASKNLELIDYLFENHYKKLPASVQNKIFIKSKMELFASEVGRIAPDFSWKENGKNLQLSKLNDAENYVLVFWSTGCSHCLKEIPQLHAFLQDKTAIKVIAFAMEKDEFVWKNMKTQLPDWHHVLGLNKWQNKTARTYNINATPTYFVLDTNKKIIGKPDELSDVKAFVEQL